jgi:2-hydroxychromene-2-carboxylate isomerase
MPAPIDFYFEFASPYGYLASLEIDALAARHGRSTRWRPIMLGAALKATGGGPNATLPMKGPYLLRDVPRMARLLGVALTMPTALPMNSLAASRAFWWLEGGDPALARRLARAVYHAHWAEGRDLSSPGAVAAVAAPLGIDPEALQAAVADPLIKARLKAETDASLERGVFGSPFIFVDDEPFWGNDRLGQVEEWLRRGGW